MRRCRKHAVEQPWSGSRLRLCWIAAQRVYRVLGAEHLRHYRPVAPEVVLRRLLSLDYLLEHPAASWLPTENDKVNTLATAGIAKAVLPHQLYQAAVGVQMLCFPHKLPVALDGERATFMFVQAEDETESAVPAIAAPCRTILPVLSTDCVSEDLSLSRRRWSSSSTRIRPELTPRSAGPEG